MRVYFTWEKEDNLTDPKCAAIAKKYGDTAEYEADIDRIFEDMADGEKLTATGMGKYKKIIIQEGELMANFYVLAPTGAGAKNGTSAADAWESLQDALDAMLAGTITTADETLYRGTETLTTSLLAKVDGAAAAHFKITGVNGSWVDDGTQAIADGDSTATDVFNMQNFDYYTLKNIQFINGTDKGIESAGLSVQLENCDCNNNGGYGAYIWASSGNNIVNCRFNNNGNIGLGLRFGRVVGSTAIGNGNIGFYVATYAFAFNCISHGNTGDGFWMGGSCGAFCCVSDGNGSDGFSDNTTRGFAFVGCRATNNTAFGFLSTGGTTRMVKCAGRNNTGGASSGTFAGDAIVTLTADGYVAIGSDDFRLTPSAEARGYDIDIDGTNTFGLSAGLQNKEDYPTAAQVEDGVTFNTSEEGIFVGTPLQIDFDVTLKLATSEQYLYIDSNTVTITGTITTTKNVTSANCYLEEKKPDEGAWTNVATALGENLAADVARNIEDIFSSPTTAAGDDGESWEFRIRMTHADITRGGEGYKAWGTRNTSTVVSTTVSRDVVVDPQTDIIVDIRG